MDSVPKSQRSRVYALVCLGVLAVGTVMFYSNSFPGRQGVWKLIAHSEPDVQCVDQHGESAADQLTNKTVPTISSQTQNDSSSNEESQTFSKQEVIKATVTLGSVTASPELVKQYDFLYGFAHVEGSLFFSPSVTNPPACPAVPPQLVGAIRVLNDAHFTFNELNAVGFNLKPGGHYEPQYCASSQKVAIVIPYRNREPHLATLLLNLHPFLQKQQLTYTIYIVNQLYDSKFNRAMLMNIGYMEALKEMKYDCFIFHDVDLLPENDRNIYTCSDENPRHMSVAIDKFNYQLPYTNILGGVTAIHRKHFFKVNGCSNQFFGWGGEDDDISARLRNAGFNIIRYPAEVARYKMIHHDKDKNNEPNPQRFDMLKYVGDRQSRDGLNSLVYELKSIEKMPLYTNISVVIDQPSVMNAKPHELNPALFT